MRNSSQKIHQILLKHDFEMFVNKSCKLIDYDDKLHSSCNSLVFFWDIYFNMPYTSYLGHFVFLKTDFNTFKILDGNHRFVLYIMALSISLERHKPSKELKELYDKLNHKYFQVTDVDREGQGIIQKKGVLSSWLDQMNIVYHWMRQRISESFKNQKDLIFFQNNLLSYSITYMVHDNITDASESLIKSNFQIAPPTIFDHSINQIRYKFQSATIGSVDRNTENWIQERLSDIRKVTALGSEIEKFVSFEAIVKYALIIKYDNLNYFIEYNELKERYYISKAHHTFECIELFVKYTSDIFRRYMPKYIEFRQLLNLGNYDLYFPFILKAIHFNLPEAQIIKLCQKLNTLVFRFLIADQPKTVFDELNTAFMFFKTKDDSDFVISSIISLTDRDDSSYSLSNDHIYKLLFCGLQDKELKYLLWRLELTMTSESKDEKEIAFKGIKSMIVKPILDSTMDESYECINRNDYTDPYSYKDIGNTFLTGNEDSAYTSAKSLVQNDFLKSLLGKDKHAINEIIHYRRERLINFALHRI